MALKAWYEYGDWNNFAQLWNGAPINGDDIAMPEGTPITAIFSGTVSKRYQDDSGGVVIVHVDNPTQARGVPYYYFAHLDTFNQLLQVGSHVNPGDFLGTSGGQNSGGTMNASPTWSTGQHIMLGTSHMNAVPVGNQVTSDLNPRWILTSLSKTGLPSSNMMLSYSSAGCKCPPGYHVIPGSSVPGGSDKCIEDGIAIAPREVPCNPGTGTTFDPIGVISNLVDALTNLPKNLPIWGEQAGVFLLALLFAILGVILLANPSMRGGAS